MTLERPTRNAKIRYSCEATANAMSAKSLTSVSNWREILP
jgi:hypothetical protein